MHIHFLGTCSGTEPMEGMHHCSWVLEIGDSLYWFDMGETCSHTAYISGLDVMDTRAIFVSHPHLDHIGGFANFLFCVMKMMNRYKKTLRHSAIKLFFRISSFSTRSKQSQRDGITAKCRLICARKV